MAPAADGVHVHSAVKGAALPIVATLSQPVITVDTLLTTVEKLTFPLVYVEATMVPGLTP
jgi:hypothetical protein